ARALELPRRPAHRPGRTRCGTPRRPDRGGNSRMSPRKRRIILIALVTALVALIVVPVAFAAGGGGSGGFSSGGGEGGGGGGSGKGFFLYLIFRAILDLILFTHGVTRFLVIGAILLAIAYFVLGPRIRRWRT